MLNLKLAEGYVDVYLSLSRYNSDLARVRSDLAKLPNTARIPIRADLRQWNRALVQVFTDLHRARTMANVPITANAGAAHSSLNLLLQHLRTVQSAARINVTAGRGAGFGGSRGAGGGMGRGASFLSGIGQGFGLGYTSNPYMLAGDALARLASAAAASSIALETQSAVLRRVAGFSAGQTANVKGALFGLSTSPGNAASMEDLMSMATIGARMGVADKGGTKGLVEFTNGMSKLATVVNDVEAGKLADEVGRSLNNFRMGTEYVEGFGSALMALDNVSIASAADILNVTQRLSGQAAAAELTIQQTMALASVLKDVGISNEVAGTSFSQIFQKMGSDSKKFAAALEIDAKQFEAAYREGPLKALGLVIDKAAKMEDTVEKMQFLDELGLKGARTSGSLLRLTAVWDRLAGRIKSADKEFITGESLAKGVAIQAATTESAGKRMKNSFLELGDAVMSKVNPALGVTAGALGDIAGGLAAVIKGTNVVNMAGAKASAAKAMPMPPEKKGPRGPRPEDMGLDQANDAVAAAFERFKTANRAVTAAKIGQEFLREEASRLMANPATFNAGLEKRVAADNAGKELEAARKRLDTAERELNEAKDRAKKVEALFKAEQRKEIVRDVAGALLGSREQLRDVMLRSGARGAAALGRAVDFGGKTEEELREMGAKERDTYQKEREKEIAKNTGESAAIASDMLSVLVEIRNKVGRAALGQ